MKIDIQAIHFHAQEALLETIHQRVEKLETFYRSIISAEVFLRVEKSDARADKHVEIKLHVPGHELFTKEHATSFEAAVAEATEALRRQLRKLKSKH